MRILITAVILLAIAAFDFSNELNALNHHCNHHIASYAKMEFDSTMHDAGKILQDRQNNPYEFIFRFTNTGTENLIISSCTGSSGSVVPSWSKEPVAPGDSSYISVMYSTESPESFHKAIRVVSNSGNSTEPITLFIKGIIVPH